MRYALVLLVFTLAVIVYANDSVVVGSGGRMRMMDGEHPSVRMVREWVRMDIYPQYYDVQAQFIFQNTGRATTVRMGFPESGFGDIGGYNIHTPGFLRFSTSVDGRPVQARRMHVQESEGGETYSALWIKTVTFAVEQTRTVRVVYRSKPGDVSMGNRFVHYDFTGGNWRSTVDESSLIVAVHLPGSTIAEVTLPNKAKLVSSGQAGNQLSYIWRNWQADGVFGLDYVTTLPGWMSIRNWAQEYDWSNMPLGHPNIIIDSTGTPNPPQWLPPVFQRGGTTFISVRAMQDYLTQLANRANRTGQVALNWHAATAEVILQAGRTTFHFRRGQKTMQVDTRQVSLPAAPMMLAREWGGTIMYVPLMPVLHELHGTATPDPKAHRITLQIPAFW